MSSDEKIHLIEGNFLFNSYYNKLIFTHQLLVDKKSHKFPSSQSINQLDNANVKFHSNPNLIETAMRGETSSNGNNRNNNVEQFESNNDTEAGKIKF
jgi:hypothetical protein